jgi:hypothetical protein
VRIDYNSTRRPPAPAIPISALRISRPYPSFQRSASSLQNLIANLELEFRASPIRINELKFSNRKFSAILTKVRGFIPSANAFKVMSVPLALPHPRKPLLPRSADREPQAVILIANTRLKSELTSKDSSRLQISNRERMAIFHRAFLAFCSFEPPAPAEALAAVACPSRRAANRYKTRLLRPGSFSGMRALHPPWRNSIFQQTASGPPRLNFGANRPSGIIRLHRGQFWKPRIAKSEFRAWFKEQR